VLTALPFYYILHVFVGLGMQHAERMRRIACPALPYFSRIISQTARFSGKKVIENEMRKCANLMKIRPVGAELFHADGRTKTKLTVAFGNFAKSTNKLSKFVEQSSGMLRHVEWEIVTDVSGGIRFHLQGREVVACLCYESWMLIRKDQW
jgi:hypothetical protein